MVVLSPAHRSQAGGGQEDSGQAPIIDRAITLPAQHRNNTCDRAGEPEHNMNPYNGQKHRVGGGNLDARHDGHFAIGHGFTTSMQVIDREAVAAASVSAIAGKTT